MNGTDWLAGGMLLGILAALWGHVKALAWRFVNVVVESAMIHEQGGWFQGQLLGWFFQNLKRSPFYDRLYGVACSVRLKTDGKDHDVTYERLGERPLLLWKGWVPILYVPTAQDSSNNGQPRAVAANGSGPTFYFIRGTLSFPKLLEDASQYVRGRRAARRFSVVTVRPQHMNEQGNSALSKSVAREDGYGGLAMSGIFHPLFVERENIHTPRTKSFNELAYDPEVHDAIEMIRMWFQAEDWYMDKEIPWNTGAELCGPPGTGKTALAAALAQDLGIPLVILPISGWSNDEFRSGWSTAVAQLPAVVLLEDFDNVFHGRANVSRPGAGMRRPTPLKAAADPGTTSGSKPNDKSNEDAEYESWFSNLLTFDVLLNAINGAERHDGMCLIVTTNKPECIDPALGCPTEFGTISSRPGRLDFALTLGHASRASKLKIASFILKGDDDLLAEFEAGLDPNAKETPAQVQEKCRRMALAKKFGKKPAVKCEVRPAFPARPSQMLVEADWAREEELRIPPMCLSMEPSTNGKHKEQ